MCVCVDGSNLSVWFRSRELTKLFESYTTYDHRVGEIQEVCIHAIHTHTCLTLHTHTSHIPHTQHISADITNLTHQLLIHNHITHSHITHSHITHHIHTHHTFTHITHHTFTHITHSHTRHRSSPQNTQRIAHT